MSNFSTTCLERLRGAIRASGIKQTEIAERLGVTPGTVNRWITRGVMPQGKRRQEELARILGVKWLWLFDDSYNGPKAANHLYKQQDEEMGLPENGRGNLPDRDAGSYGAPLLDGHKIQRTYEPDEAWYIDAVREILRSGERGTIVALQSNISQFREQVRDKAFIRDIQIQNQELMERVAELERSKPLRETGPAVSRRDPSWPEPKPKKSNG